MTTTTQKCKRKICKDKWAISLFYAQILYNHIIAIYFN